MNKDNLKGFFIGSTVLAVLSGYLSIVLGQQKDNRLFYGFLLVPVFLYIGYLFYRKYKRLEAILFVRESWGRPMDKKRDFPHIRAYFDKVGKEDEQSLIIDDQTWEDLNMDKIYDLLDRTLSTPGEHALYNILRRPLLKGELLKERKEIINLFQKDNGLRENIQIQLNKLGRNSKVDIPDLLWEEETGDTRKKYMYYAAAALPLVLAATIPFTGGRSIVLVAMSYAMNMYIHFKAAGEIRGKISAISYLGDVITAALKISAIQDTALEDFGAVLRKTAKGCEKISRKTEKLGSMEGIDLFADYIKIMFMSDERNYFSSIEKINKHREDLKKLYNTLGELDALISAASYREQVKDYVEPELTAEERFLQACDLRHPLIEEPVPNSIEIIEGGIILTGSNMSGKSTFLRTIGVNALLAQTLFTCLAKEYKGSYFNIITSISPQDNILMGKSYYLGEAEALLRIIETCGQEIPSLCIIDEIFRGTNPVERISASAEILRYLMQHNALVIVATHDLELTEIAGDSYECYYFTEDVDDEGLKFDYMIRKGVSPTRNAIKLLRFIGYPEEIINNSFARIESLNTGK
jgi:DNA mismatch repair ATPase MutS